jgi:16S rRNA (cytidine1402-2'-O)-methyltransferase
VDRTFATKKIRTPPREALRNARPERTFLVEGASVVAPPLGPGLFVVATPIGNLADVTLRALAILAAADEILAEDTRVSKTLLARYGIKTALSPYHEHNAAAARPRALRRIIEGASLALISDAGTPLISDPGYKLVAEALSIGLNVQSAPGASAALAALCVAGLPTDRFFFEGFLPPKSSARRARINALAAVPGTLVFYEAPSRIPETMADLALELGPRQAAVARELTKLHEETRRGALDALASHYAVEGPPRGEIVIIVGPPLAQAEISDDGLDQEILDALKTLSVKDATAMIAAKYGLPRRQVYARALAIAGATR